MALFPNVRLEHRLLAIDQAGTVDLILEIATPQLAGPTARPAASVAIVVDESGSMAGAKLDTACRCLVWLAGRLDARDRVALVGFDDEARLLQPLIAATTTDVRRAIAQLRPRGCTNLSGGFLLGLEQLEATAEGPKTLLLLSDGLANQGITDPDTLIGIAKGAAERGVVVSTIGFGRDFSEDLLRAMADAGRGNAHHVETPEQAPAVFAEELAGLTHLVAQTVSVEIQPGAHVVQVDALNDFPATAGPGGVRLELGDAYAGDTRRVVVRLHVPELSFLGPCPVAELVLRYTAVIGSPERHTVRIPVAVNLVSATEAAAEASDLAVTSEVQSLLADRAREEAIRLADAGDLASAQQVLRQASVRLRSASKDGGLMGRLGAKADELLEEHLLFDQSVYDLAARKKASYRSHSSKRNRGRTSE